jgi:hypothetical protein
MRRGHPHTGAAGGGIIGQRNAVTRCRYRRTPCRSEIHIAGEALLHRERMQSLEEVLDPARFCRIHRSAIVNLARVCACGAGA